MMAQVAGKPLVSIIVPCFNEHDNVAPFFKELKRAIAKTHYTYEFIFVDDGSSDATIRSIRQLAKKDRRVLPLQLARNFGKEIAITAGVHAAQGDAAITIDVDLQHPPRLIPEFLSKWEDGAEVVIGIRERNKIYANGPKRWGSHMFYAIMGAISDVELIPGATDYRLIDRVVIEEFNRFTERNRMTRGLIDWLGFDYDTITFEPEKRRHGTAAYSLRKLFGLAFNSFVAMSLLPLKLAGYIGVSIMLLSGLTGVFVLVEQEILGDPMGLAITGTGELAILLVFLVGLMLAAIGLIGLYVAAIHTEVINRPLYVVRRPRTRRRTGRSSIVSVTKQAVKDHDSETHPMVELER